MGFILRRVKKIISDCRFYPYYRQNSNRIKKFENLHKNERCFIVGTGPSLNKTNLRLLDGEIVFGVNTLYRGCEDFGLKCKYYAVSDKLVWNNHYRNILDLDNTLFLTSHCGEEYLHNKGFYDQICKSEPYIIKDLGPIWEAKKNTFDVTEGCYWGYTIIIDFCLQMAFYMGFKTVYLIGCDCDYSGLHRFDGLKTECLSGGAVGDWSKVFASYEICKKVYQQNGRAIINCTVGGKLEIFPRAKLEEII